MPLDGRALDAVTESDLVALVAAAEAERRTLDYKQTLPGTSDGEKKEFLADVSSFANSMGGHLIYGMTEEAGVPTGVPGLAGVDQDAARLRLESSIRDGISPRLAGVQTVSVPLANGCSVIVIRVPRSWARPHMVSFRGGSRFYGRNSAGKYPYDVTEIRTAFLQVEGAGQRLREWRDSRLTRLDANATPVPLEDGPRVVLHVTGLDAQDLHSVTQAEVLEANGNFLHSIHADWKYRHNLDGFLAWSNCGYVQVFRNGRIEEVITTDFWAADGKPLVPVVDIERRLLDSSSRFLRALHALGTSPPYVVFITLVGVEGRKLSVPLSREEQIREHVLASSDGGRQAIDRKEVSLPEILIDDPATDTGRALRPAFDALWQAGDWSRCEDYNEDGQWEPRKVPRR